MSDLNKLGGQHYDMIRRCYNEKYVAYKDYGAKGIRVCEEWHDRDTFKAWARANGYVAGKRVLRYDTKGDYCPENCYIGDSPYKARARYQNKIRKERAEVNRQKKAELGIEHYKDSPLESVYYGMKNRCYNPNFDHYYCYGGRGIKICDEWLGKDGLYNFIKWAMNKGGYEEGLTIDRINVDGDYCPDNCRFATWLQQAGNKRNTRAFIVDGEYYSKTGFCRLHGFTYNEYKKLKNKGMTITQILDALEK